MLPFHGSGPSDNLLLDISPAMDASSLGLDDCMSIFSLSNHDGALGSLVGTSFTESAIPSTSGGSIGMRTPYFGGIDEHLSPSLPPLALPEPMDLESCLDATPTEAPASTSFLSTSSSGASFPPTQRQAIERLVPLLKCPYEHCTMSFVQDKQLQ